MAEITEVPLYSVLSLLRPAVPLDSALFFRNFFAVFVAMNVQDGHVIERLAAVHTLVLPSAFVVEVVYRKHIKDNISSQLPDSSYANVYLSCV